MAKFMQWLELSKLDGQVVAIRWKCGAEIGRLVA
jgi:hypothetical protein